MAEVRELKVEKHPAETAEKVRPFNGVKKSPVEFSIAKRRKVPPFKGGRGIKPLILISYLLILNSKLLPLNHKLPLRGCLAVLQAVHVHPCWQAF